MSQLSLFTNNDERTNRQLECVQKWVDNKKRGTILAATGFGKTRVGLQAIKRFQAKFPEHLIIVAVPSDAIRIQWEKELSNWNLKAEVKTYYDTSRHKYECTMLVLDEIQKVAADTLFSTFDNVKYKLILGLTATFERLDGRDKLIAKYCPVIDEITISECISKGWLSDYTEYLVLIEPEDIEDYNKVNRQFLDHFSYFDYNFNKAMAMFSDWKYRVRYIKEHNLSKEEGKILMAHAAGFNRTMQARKKYINNHPKKIELTNLILEHRSDKKCITFSNTIAMAERIGYGQVYSGKDSVKKGRAKLEEFLLQSSGVINSIRRLTEGFNDPTISVAVVLGFDSSKTRKTQSIGRVIRAFEGKKAEVFNLVLKGTVEETWFANSNTNSNYITIDEENLINVLNGTEFTKKKNKVTKMKFRF